MGHLWFNNLMQWTFLKIIKTVSLIILSYLVDLTSYRRSSLERKEYLECQLFSVGSSCHVGWLLGSKPLSLMLDNKSSQMFQKQIAESANLWHQIS